MQTLKSLGEKKDNFFSLMPDYVIFSDEKNVFYIKERRLVHIYIFFFVRTGQKVSTLTLINHYNDFQFFFIIVKTGLYFEIEY